MDEEALVRRLDELERMVAKGGPVGIAACRAELAAWRQREPDSEFRLSLPTPISQAVFVGVCRSYGLKPFRAPKQRQSTISVRAPTGFVYGVLKPRLDAMVVEMEDAALAAVERVMEKWSAMPGAQNQAGADTQATNS